MADSKISALPASTTPLAGTEILPVVQSGTTKQVSVANLTAGRAVTVASLSATTGPVAVNSSGGYAQFTPDVGALTGGYGANNTARQWLAGGIGNNTNQVGHYVKSVMTGNGGGGGTASLQFGQLAWSGTAFIEGTAQLTLDKDGNWVIGTAAKGVNFTANSAAAGMTSQLLNWYEEGTFTPTATNITGTNTYAGTYTRIGNRVYFEIIITTTTTIVITGASSTLSLPFASGKDNTCAAANRSTGAGYGTGLITGSSAYPPTCNPTAAQSIVVSGSYRV